MHLKDKHTNKNWTHDHDQSVFHTTKKTGSMIQNDTTTTTNKQINEYYLNITEVLSIDKDKMETSKSKWVNSNYILYGVNSLRVKGFEILKNFVICVIRT